MPYQHRVAVEVDRVELGEPVIGLAATISMAGGMGDVYREMPELASADNYFWNGAKSANSQGYVLGVDIFVSADIAGIAPEPRDDGSIDMKGLLALTNLAPAESGARLGQR